ncbi:MAG: AMMECR1 domain-containing protein [Chitinispirillaceae bacterium]|nr:AMMECR1 domain-containing protein [Chitinispirillaceae bacterium]
MHFRKTVTLHVGKKPIVSEVEQDTLCAIARHSIMYYLDSGKVPPPPLTGLTTLNTMRGCMIKIRVGGEVRGVAGYILPIKPLSAGVAEMACRAASGSGRYSPLKPEDLDSAFIELTIVSDLKTIESDTSITLETDGLIISRGNNVGGIVMPDEVVRCSSSDAALDTLLTRSRTSKEEWLQKGVTIQTFTVQIFREQGSLPEK